MRMEYATVGGDQRGEREGNGKEGREWGRVDSVGASVLGETAEQLRYLNKTVCWGGVLAGSACR